MRIQGKTIRTPRKKKKIAKKEGMYRPDLQKLFFDHPDPMEDVFKRYSEAPMPTQQQIDNYKKLLGYGK